MRIPMLHKKVTVLSKDGWYGYSTQRGNKAHNKHKFQVCSLMTNTQMLDVLSQN